MVQPTEVIDLQRTHCETVATWGGRSKTSAVSDRREMWLHSNIQNGPELFVQKSTVTQTRSRCLRFFNHPIYCNVEVANCQQRTV